MFPEDDRSVMEDWVVVIGFAGNASEPDCLMEVVTSLPGTFKENSPATSPLTPTETSAEVTAGLHSCSEAADLQSHDHRLAVPPSSFQLPDLSTLTHRELSVLKSTLEQELAMESRISRLQA